MYEPFEPPLTKRLLTRMDQLRRGRELFVAYVWSLNSKLSSKSLWDEAPFMTRWDEGSCWTIYRASASVD